MAPPSTQGEALRGNQWASIPSNQRRRTGPGLRFTEACVASLRVSRGIRAPQPPAVASSEHDGEAVSFAKASEILHVAR